MDVFVHDPVYALGDLSFSVEDSTGAGWTLSEADVLREAGFDTHHVCAADTTAYELARNAVGQLNGALVDTSAIIYSTCLPMNGSEGSVAAFEESRDVKHLMDFPCSRLQSEFGMRDAITVGLNQQACTGMLGSLRIAAGLLAVEDDFESVLCVTADRFPEGAIYEQSYNLISDGAAAVMVSREARGYRLLACHHIANGALVQASNDESVGVYFNYTHRLIRETLAKASLEMEDVEWILPQNMNRKAWDILARVVNVDPERIYQDSLADVAHVISGDNVVNLNRLEASDRIESGDRLLLIMAGYGMNWQAVLMEKM